MQDEEYNRLLVDMLPRMRRAASVVIRDQEVEDAVQEACVQSLRFRTRFSNDGRNAAPWFCTIARFEAIRIIRRAHGGMLALPKQMSAPEQIERETGRREQQEQWHGWLDRAIQKLAPLEREAIRLYLHGDLGRGSGHAHKLRQKYRLRAENKLIAMWHVSSSKPDVSLLLN